MDDFPSLRHWLALALIVATSMVAGQVIGWEWRALICFAGLGSALAIWNAAPDESTLAAESQTEEAETDAPSSITAHTDFQKLIEAIDGPVMLIEKGRVALANGEAQALLGEQIEGQNIRSAIRHAGAVEYIDRGEMDASSETRGRKPIILTGIGRPDQQWQLRVMNFSPGERIVLLSDRTRAQAAERMRVDFVANASHELNTPLASIRGFIETLSDDSAGGNSQIRNRFLAIMEKEATRMQALIRDLISLSQIQSQRFDALTERVSIEELVDEVVDNLRVGSLERAGDIVVEHSAETPLVLGDRKQLTQVASNIIGNAMKYGRAGTPILVNCSASRSGSMLSFTVSDEGEGIAPEHLPRLTERFYRVDSGRSRSLGGTGLGLSLVKHIVDRHRGHFNITSQIGKGTRVHVLLPAAPRKQAD